MNIVTFYFLLLGLFTGFILGLVFYNTIFKRDKKLLDDLNKKYKYYQKEIDFVNTHRKDIDDFLRSKK